MYMEDGLVLQEQPDEDGEGQQHVEKAKGVGGEEYEQRVGELWGVKQESACARDGIREGGGRGGGGGGRVVSPPFINAAEQVGGEGRDARKRKAPLPVVGGEKREGGGGRGREVISLLSDSGEEDHSESLRGGQKRRLKMERVQAEEHQDEEEGGESGEENDDDSERFEATQAIPASPLPPVPKAPPPPPPPPPRPPPPATAAATAAATGARTVAAGGGGGGGGLATAAATARVITSGKLFFDGGSRGNPGIAGCGAVMYDDLSGKKLWSLSAFLGHDKTNNQAEYAALCFGLEEALKRGVSSIQVFGDSTLVVKQVQGVWKVKNAGMRVWHSKALALGKKFKRFRICFVPREENKVADALANEGMDGRREGGAVVVEEG